MSEPAAGSGWGPGTATRVKATGTGATTPGSRHAGGALSVRDAVAGSSIPSDSAMELTAASRL